MTATLIHIAVVSVFAATIAYSLRDIWRQLRRPVRPYSKGARHD